MMNFSDQALRAMRGLWRKRSEPDPGDDTRLLTLPVPADPAGVEPLLAEILNLGTRLLSARELGPALDLVARRVGMVLSAATMMCLRVQDWRMDSALVCPWGEPAVCGEDVIDLDQLVPVLGHESPLGEALAHGQPRAAVPLHQAHPWRPENCSYIAVLPVMHGGQAIAAIEWHDGPPLSTTQLQLLQLLALQLTEVADREWRQQEVPLGNRLLGRFGLMTSRAGRGVAVTDEHGLIEWINPAFTETTGYDEAQSIGQPLWEVVTRGINDPSRAMLLRESFRHGTAFIGEFETRHGPAGTDPYTPYWLEVDALAMLDDRGVRLQYVCLCNDITERKQREFSFEEGRDLMTALTENIPISLLVLDAREFGVVALNRHAEVEFGAQRDFTPGCDLDEVLGSGVLQRLEPSLREALARSGAVEQDFTWPTDDGERLINVRHVAVRDRVGSARLVICQLRDITERRRTELTLLETERRYKELVDSIDEGVYVTTPQHDQYSYVGARMYEIFGMGREDLETDAQLPRRRVLPEDRAAVDQQREQARTSGTTDLVFRIRHPQRGVRWLRQRTRTREMPNGAVRVYGLVDDVTDDREREIQLKAARDAAEAASQAKSQFLASMSHEIRTPMNGILGMTELLLGTQLGDKQRRFAQSVYRSGESLLEMINDILDFAKIEAGRLELAPIEFVLRSVVEDTLELLAPRAHEKGLELNFRETPGLPHTVLADPLRLRQVLTNLIGNAIKFTEHGEVEVSLKLRADQSAAADPDTLILEFSVRDTGIGIAPEVLPRLFNAFMQAHGGMARRYGGTGLGLAISRQLVELMGGHIEVESRPGQGSVFRFWSPVQHGSRADMQQAELQPLPLLRVLLVEDHPTNRTVLENMLRSWGLEVVCAEDGRVALDLLLAQGPDDEPFDLALVDWYMPRMDGIEFARELQQRQLQPQMKLILLSSVSAPDDARQALGAGFAAFLHKPVRTNELRQAILGVVAAAPDAQVPVTAPQIDRLVLVVEDNPVNQEVMSQMLIRLGCRVRVASSALEGLRALCEQRFDLVLMDINMPGMDGVEALGWLRRGRNPRFLFVTPSETPVVAVTANALAGDEERYLNLGFDAYLSKPYRLGQLLLVLRRVFHMPQESQPGGLDDTPSRRLALMAAAARETAAASELAAPPVVAPAAVVAAEPPLLDPEALERLRQLDSSGQNRLLVRVLKAFETSVERLGAQLEDGLRTRDPAALRHVVHTLKSSSGSVGANRLSSLCAETEVQIRQGAEFEQLLPGLGQVQQELTRVRQGLQKMKDLENA